MTENIQSNRREPIAYSPIAQSYRTHSILKYDSIYKEKSTMAALNLITLFKELYPGVEIDDPILREKSSKSILGKIRNLQIERLSKLCAIEGLDNADTNALYFLLSDRIDEGFEALERPLMKKLLKDLLVTDIHKMNISALEKNLIDSENLSTSSKSALLRILYSKIYRSKLDNKNQLLDELDCKYGQKAADMSGNPENNLLNYSNIEAIQKLQYEIKNNNDPSFLNKLERLRDEQEFLRCKDLRGMQIVINSIPDDFETDNPELELMLKLRSTLPKGSENYKKIDSKCINILSADFMNKLSTSQELLQEREPSLRIIRDTRKHKNKTNGYVAEHVKFDLDSNPDYSLELQVKSVYVDELSHGNGSASHSKRAGKKRVLPDFNLPAQDFVKHLRFALPSFTVFEKLNDQYIPYNLSIYENSFKFFSEVFNIDHPSAIKLVELLDSQKDLLGSPYSRFRRKDSFVKGNLNYSNPNTQKTIVNCKFNSAKGSVADVSPTHSSNGSATGVAPAHSSQESDLEK